MHQRAVGREPISGLRWARRAAAVLLIAVLGAPLAIVGERRDRAAAAPAGSVFVPVEPCRLLDTRERGGPLPTGGSVRVEVAGRCGIGEGSSAAALVVTTVDSSGSGFVTVSAAGKQRPVASNLNFDATTIVANGAITELGGGAIDVYVNRATHVVIDVNGSFVPVEGPAAAGRFTPAPPTRLLDTRETGQRGAGDVVVPVPDAARGARALAINLTIVDAVAPGFVSLRRAGTPRTNSSAGNVDELERTRALTTIVPVSASGFVVFRSVRADVVVDMSGWFTGASASASEDGLFIAQPAQRVLDSRSANVALHRGGTIEQAFAQPHRAVVANLTVLDTVAPGHVTAYPAGTPRPLVSAINATWRRPVANLSFMQLSTRGVAFYSHRGTRLLIDVVGWFTGAPRTATAPVPSNAIPSLGGRVLLVSDSAFAGIRWSGQLDALTGATFFADLESCRRLIGWSCRGREGYRPTTAVGAVGAAPGRFETLVVAAGYNDAGSTFAAAIDDVVTTARRRGISRVVWLDYRTDVGYISPNGATASTFASHNARLREAVASGRYPELEVVDWNDYSAGRTGWFTDDRLHQTSLGAERAADFISRTLAHLERRTCPSEGQSTPGGWCAEPT